MIVFVLVSKKVAQNGFKKIFNFLLDVHRWT